MTKYVFYTTRSDERWDSIAYKYLGNCYDFAKLIEANEHIPIKGTIKEGTEIRIPIDETDKTQDKSKFPIWKRESS